jgi:hypothetical protein
MELRFSFLAQNDLLDARCKRLRISVVLFKNNVVRSAKGNTNMVSIESHSESKKASTKYDAGS